MHGYFWVSSSSLRIDETLSAQSDNFVGRALGINNFDGQLLRFEFFDLVLCFISFWFVDSKFHACFTA